MDFSDSMFYFPFNGCEGWGCEKDNGDAYITGLPMDGAELFGFELREIGRDLREGKLRHAIARGGIPYVIKQDMGSIHLKYSNESEFIVAGHDYPHSILYRAELKEILFSFQNTKYRISISSLFETLAEINDFLNLMHGIQSLVNILDERS